MDAHESDGARRIARAHARVEEQHRHLGELRSAIERTLERGSLARVQEETSRFAGVLEAHFELEEQAYYPSVEAVDERAKGRLDHLLGEHRRFRDQLEQLHDLLERSDLDAFRGRFEDFVTALGEHETREETTLAQLHEPAPPPR